MNEELLIALIPIIADIIAGYLPDRWVSYIGIVRRILAAISKIKGVK